MKLILISIAFILLLWLGEYLRGCHVFALGQKSCGGL